MSRERLMDPITISIAEGARISGLSTRTLHRLAKAGDLESRKVGQRRLILRSSLLKIIGCEEGVGE